ncbi:proprotein convertase subtilisin/kexin type 9-like [Ptychodera flava]|uniref:proprotein convertase subtilisin/kexin type 9-like n=1 Tax=Ptychodera flava TaxID=63121 RepID=UPI00396A3786
MVKIVALAVSLLLVSLGHETSAGLNCVTRWSKLSHTRDDAQARVTCQGNEKMTGCSSYQPGPGGHGTRDGEFIHVSSTGRVSCAARNGKEGTGVRAYARCCTADGLTCGYADGARSGRQYNDSSTVSFSTSDDSTFMTGCSASTFWRNLNGASPNPINASIEVDTRNGQCVALNGRGGLGVYAHGVYCSAPNLTCKTKWSEKSQGGVGAVATVTCEEEWTLTGCNAYTPYKENDGSYVLSKFSMSTNV